MNDNNLTRKISFGDPVQIAGIKGLVTGLVNIGIIASRGGLFPCIDLAVAAGPWGLSGTA